MVLRYPPLKHPHCKCDHMDENKIGEATMAMAHIFAQTVAVNHQNAELCSRQMVVAMMVAARMVTYNSEPPQSETGQAIDIAEAYEIAKREWPVIQAMAESYTQRKN